jgi:hypothetical protein
MVFCNQCGTQLIESAKFCPQCGAGVHVGLTPTETSPQQCGNTAMPTVASNRRQVSFQPAYWEQEYTKIVPKRKPNPKKEFETMKTANDQFCEALQKSGFLIEKLIGINDVAVYVDNTHKELCIKPYRYAPVIIKKFGDVTDYDVLEDGDTIHSGQTGGAVLGALTGGLLFGEAGMIAGSMIGQSGQTSSYTNCNTLQVRIYLNDFNNPMVAIPLIVSATRKHTEFYQSRFQVAQDLVALLYFIRNNA